MGDYFDLFEFERRFAIDRDELRKRYYQLSRRFHPDFYAEKSDGERKIAGDNSAILNDAFKTLSDPIRRAEYILSIRKGNIPSEPSPPQDLFEEILEIGELLVDSKGDGPHEEIITEEREKLQKAKKRFMEKYTDLLNSLESLFEKLLIDGDDANSEIISRLNNLKYIEKTVSRIDNCLGRTGD